MQALKRIIFTIVLVLGFQASWAQVILKGAVLNAYDSMPIEAAHVYKSNNRTGTFTDVLGSFSLQVQHNDTLMVSALGFGTMPLLVSLVAASGTLQTIVWLVPRPLWLQEVVVRPDVPLPTNYTLQLIDTDSSFVPTKPQEWSMGGSGAGVEFTGLITLLANQFNSEYKQLKKLRQIKEEEYRAWHEKQVLKTRLSASFVTRNTALISEEVKDFVAFWSPPISWLERVGDYELIMRMREVEQAYILRLKRLEASDTAQSTSLELRKLLDN